MLASRVPARWLVSLALLLAAPGAAHAEGQVVEVEVGQTIELETGYARGLLCDDLTIIDADLREKTEETNALYITGKVIGTTLCRVGTAPLHVRLLFDIHVVAAKPRPAPAAPVKPH